MEFHECKWLNELNLNKPKFYLRYVECILAAFDNKQDSLHFLIFLNNEHPHIKFTINKLNKLNKLKINKLTIPSPFSMYSFQVSIIKTSHFKHIRN